MAESTSNDSAPDESAPKGGATAQPGSTQGGSDATTKDIQSTPEHQLTDALEILGQSLSDQAFWIGFVLVVLFALSRFAVTGERADEADPPLVARSLTTRFRYYLSATAYVACYEFLYLVLVGFGSFPEFQALLKQLIGTLTVKVDGGTAPIGSPAWAALVTSSLLPAVPGFKVADKRVRDFLHRFASIPSKAHALADELLAALAVEQEQGRRADLVADFPNLSDSDRVLVGQLRRLADAPETLQDSRKNPRNAEDYVKFFSTWWEPFRRASAREKEFLEAAAQAKEPSPVLTRNLRQMVDHLSRFVACALLQVEPSEQDVRVTAQRRLGLTALKGLEFAFSLKQIVLGGILIALITFVSGVVSLGAVQLAVPHAKLIGFIASWVPYAVLMLLPPFMLAAGLQLYFADRWRHRSGKPPWEDQVLALCALTAAAFGIGLLPPLAGTAMGPGLEGDLWVLQVLPFALAPAALAFVFFFLANWHATAQRLGNFAVDFVIFGVVSGLVVLLATWIATELGGSDFADLSGSKEIAKRPDVDATDPSIRFDNSVAMRVLPITAGFMGGLLGAVQCLISRHMPAAESGPGTEQPAAEPDGGNGQAPAATVS